MKTRTVDSYNEIEINDDFISGPWIKKCILNFEFERENEYSLYM